MNQEKIGGFLRELRRERDMTQGELAEILGVTNRSVSRWENGNNLPDLDLLVQVAEYFDVGLEEILNGERKVDEMDKKTKETVLQVADYSNQEKQRMVRRVRWLMLVGLAAFAVYFVIDFCEVGMQSPYFEISNVALGIVLGALLCGVLFTTRYGEKLRAAKKRLLSRK